MKPGIVAGAIMLAAGAAIAWMASRVAVSPGYAFVGPRVFPYVIASLFVVVGIGFVGAAIFAPRAVDQPPGDASVSARSIGWVLAGLAANLAGLALLGFAFAAAIQYALTARAFGSDRLAIDLLCGLAVATSAYLLFSLVLGVRVPPGPVLEALF